MAEHNEIVIRLSAMGDILLTVPTLRAMAKNGISVHLVIHKRWAALAEFLPARVHLYGGTGSLIRLASELNKLNAETLFDLQGKLSSIALRMLLNAPITRVYQKRTPFEQLEAIRGRYPLRFIDSRPVWQKYAEVCGVDVSNPNPSLNLSESRLKEAKSTLDSLELEPNKYVLIHPDASKPGKVIPGELFAALTGLIQDKIAVIGTSLNQLPQTKKPIIDLRGKIQLQKLPCLMKYAKAVVSSDSGPMHMARAVNTPLAAFFFQTDPTLGFEPVTGRHVKVFSKPLPCKPCSLHGQNASCPKNSFECRKLDIKSVCEELDEFLSTLP